MQVLEEKLRKEITIQNVVCTADLKQKVAVKRRILSDSDRL